MNTAGTSSCDEACSGGGYPGTHQAAAPAHDGWYSVAAAGAGYGYGNTPVTTRGNTPRGVEITPPTVVHVASAGAGFHWDDAGIGAGGALVLATLLVGGGLVIVTARRRTTTRSA